MLGRLCLDWEDFPQPTTGGEADDADDSDGGEDEEEGGEDDALEWTPGDSDGGVDSACEEEGDPME